MPDPTVYLDQNVFARADEWGEHDALADLSRTRASLLLSQLHLHETLDIPSVDARRQRLNLLTNLEACYAEPVRYKTGSEFFDEVRTHRPRWLNPTPLLPTPLQQAKHETRDEYTLARTDPDRLLDLYTEHFLLGWNRAEEVFVDAQKASRNARVERFPDSDLLLLGYRVVQLPRKVSRTDPEDRWRYGSLQWWWFALYTELALGGSGRTTIRPLLSPHYLCEEDLIAFWLNEARPDKMPYSFLRSTVNWFMLDRKVPRRGNSRDINHAVFAADVDLFVTMDKNLFRALESVRRLDPSLCGQPVYLPNNDRSVVTTLLRVLESRS